MKLHDLRQEYSSRPIDVDSVCESPFRQFEAWFQDATEAEVLEPNAMVLATADKQGQPSSRTVLLKYFDNSGFVFFTNYESRKATQMEENNKVSMLFPWYALQRQVEISGVTEKLSVAESAKYFATRPRGSQLGAWVSAQSTVISKRSVLKNKLVEITRRFADGEIPMPVNWGGIRVKPTRFEFWQGGGNRLHDRIEYSPLDTTSGWKRQRLAP